MKIALIGATGFVGKPILEEALARGHEVSAISRSIGEISNQLGLRKIGHDILESSEKSGEVLSGHDVIIDAYSPSRKNITPAIFQVIVDAHKVILQATRLSKVPRFVAVGGAGSLKVPSGQEYIDSDLYPPQYNEFKPSIRGTRELFYLLEQEDSFDWVFLAPPAALLPGKKTGIYRKGKNHMLFNAEGESTISLPDYAIAMLDEVENPIHHCERFTVGY